jgi:hypothetical protein
MNVCIEAAYGKNAYSFTGKERNALIAAEMQRLHTTHNLTNSGAMVNKNAILCSYYHGRLMAS